MMRDDSCTQVIRVISLGFIRVTRATRVTKVTFTEAYITQMLTLTPPQDNPDDPGNPKPKRGLS